MKVRQLSRLHLIKQINLCKRRMLFSFSTKNVSFFSPNRPRVRSFLKIQTAMSCPHVPHTFIFIFQLANPMKLHKFSFLLLCHVVRVLWPGVKIWDQVCSHRQLAAPPTRLPAVVLTENCSRQRMKKHGFPGPKARTVGFALPDWPREKGMAQSAGQGHWSDEKIIQHPHPPPAPGPHAASNHLWAVTEPDWAERIWVGNFKTCSYFCGCERICITHSVLMDFPMFNPDNPFCWHVQIMNLLCVWSPFPSCSWVLFLVVR